MTDEEVKTKFSSVAGATPITDIKSLDAALTALFWFRADNNLEIYAVVRRQLDERVMPDLSTCSSETREAGSAI